MNVKTRYIGKQIVTISFIKECVAEFGSAVMMSVYLNKDSSKNAWEYMKMFAENPTEVIEGALGMIQKMFTHLDKLQEVANESD